MSTPLLVQTLVVVGAVAWSVLFAAKRFLPVTVRRMQARVLETLDRSSSPAWLRDLARRAQPHSTSGSSCGDGCSACGGCAAAAATPAVAEPAVEAQPLVFRPRSKS
ncbi:MAG: DUF6587 family protein [Dokdonella sp.]